MNVIWNDGYNPAYAGTLDIAPASGSKNARVDVSDGVNDALDRTTTISVELQNGTKEDVKVTQTGKREAFMMGGVAFMTADGQTFNVLK